MLRILTFEPDHLRELKDFGGQTIHLDPNHAEDLHISGPAFSGFINGEIIGVAGVCMLHEYRGMAWAAVRRTFTKHFISVHRAVKIFLDNTDIARIECQVEVDYKPGHRWALALGFRPEGPTMPFFLPGGLAAQQYVRLKVEQDGDWSDHSGRLRRCGGDRGDPAG